MSWALEEKRQLLREQTGGGGVVDLVLGRLATARMIDTTCAVILNERGRSEGSLVILLVVAETLGSTPARIADRIGAT